MANFDGSTNKYINKYIDLNINYTFFNKDEDLKEHYKDLAKKFLDDSWKVSYNKDAEFNKPMDIYLGKNKLPPGVTVYYEYYPATLSYMVTLIGPHGKSKKFNLTAESLMDISPEMVNYMLDTMAPAFVSNHGYVPSSMYNTVDEVHSFRPQPLSLSRASTSLPGIKTAVNLPCQPCKIYASYPPISLHTAIMHLNDDHKWTREAIADWVDTIPDLMQDFTPIQPDRA